MVCQDHPATAQLCTGTIPPATKLAHEHGRTSTSGIAAGYHGQPTTPAGSCLRMAALKAAACSSPILEGGMSPQVMENWAARLVPAGAAGADSSLPFPSACIKGANAVANAFGAMQWRMCSGSGLQRYGVAADGAQAIVCGSGRAGNQPTGIPLQVRA